MVMFRRLRDGCDPADTHNNTLGIINKGNLLGIRNYQRRTDLHILIEGFEDSTLVYCVLDPVCRKAQIGLSIWIIIDGKPMYQLVNVIFVALSEHCPAEGYCRQ